MTIIEEGRLKFRRDYYKEGFIDVYTGDQADDPNLPTRPRYNLNTVFQWIRANGEGKWHCVSRSRESYSVWRQFRDLTAEEIIEAINDKQ